MKRFLIIVLILLVTGFILLRVVRAKVGHDLSAPVYQPALTPTPTVVIDRTHSTHTSLFVPTWALDSISDGFDQYIYFGISPTSHGISSDDTDVKEIDSFTSAVPQGKKTLLTLEMTNSATNSKILLDKTLQQQIISQTITIAKENGFSGVVLDLEISGIPFTSLIDGISSFSKSLDQQVKASGLAFDVTLYGDTFYRLRPFDVKTIAKNSDMVMIMAYDFHKTRDPGPNFPLGGQDIYGYDLGKMADDFLQAVPNQKLGVIFGLFGYDWPVDSQGNAIGTGVALTDQQIQNKFLNKCDFKNCQIKKDPVSAETEITYIDDSGERHEVWFEDMQSVDTKEQLLRQKGIGNFSFWANSYF
ncbi:MAG TPA: glycosyl hydrolase family 18 protein [Candidatus Saccharimonadales bacterium]|nr:glycosyl hydrolase family 18 protein [Candidatus Saccharimonadales bacterium]